MPNLVSADVVERISDLRQPPCDVRDGVLWRRNSYKNTKTKLSMITAARIRTFKYLRASYISFPNVMAKVYLNFYKITIA